MTVRSALDECEPDRSTASDRVIAHRPPESDRATALNRVTGCSALDAIGSDHNAARDRAISRRQLETDLYTGPFRATTDQNLEHSRANVRRELTLDARTESGDDESFVAILSARTASAETVSTINSDCFVPQQQSVAPPAFCAITTSLAHRPLRTPPLPVPLPVPLVSTTMANPTSQQSHHGKTPHADRSPPCTSAPITAASTGSTPTTPPVAAPAGAPTAGAPTAGAPVAPPPPIQAPPAAPATSPATAAHVVSPPTIPYAPPPEWIRSAFPPYAWEDLECSTQEDYS